MSTSYTKLVGNEAQGSGIAPKTSDGTGVGINGMPTGHFKGSSFKRSDITVAWINGTNTFTLSDTEYSVHVRDFSGEKYALIAVRTPSSKGVETTSAMSETGSEGWVSDAVLDHLKSYKDWRILTTEADLSNKTYTKKYSEMPPLIQDLGSVNQDRLLWSEDSGSSHTGGDYDIISAPGAYTKNQYRASINVLWETHNGAVPPTGDKIEYAKLLVWIQVA